MRDDRLAEITGQRFERACGRLSIEASAFCGSKPLGRQSGCLAFMPPASLLASYCRQGGVANHTMKPGNGLIGRTSLRGEFEKGLLHNIFGHSTPLPRVQHQRCRVLIDQLSQSRGVHYLHDADRGISSQKSTP
jgi:hypothetical protein